VFVFFRMKTILSNQTVDIPDNGMLNIKHPVLTIHLYGMV